MKTQKCRRQNEKHQNEKSALVELCGTCIDDLPEGVLLHILSFLQTPTAIQTTAVSPRWRNLWHSVPILHFDMFEFHSRIPEKSYGETRQLFAENVCQTLIHHPRDFPLRKFKLDFYYRDYASIRSYVNSWIRFAVSSKVVELDLDLATIYQR